MVKRKKKIKKKEKIKAHKEKKVEIKLDKYRKGSERNVCTRHG
jgi:hypothetical protein